MWPVACVSEWFPLRLQPRSGRCSMHSTSDPEHQGYELLWSVCVRGSVRQGCDKNCSVLAQPPRTHHLCTTYVHFRLKFTHSVNHIRALQEHWFTDTLWVYTTTLTDTLIAPNSTMFSKNQFNSYQLTTLHIVQPQACCGQLRCAGHVQFNRHPKLASSAVWSPLFAFCLTAGC